MMTTKTMDTISNQNAVYAMNSTNPIAMSVKSGSTVVFETFDCFENQITSIDHDMQTLDWERVNPATGPLFIEEAKAGDLLKVEINKIEIADTFTMITGKNMGVMGHHLQKTLIKKCKIDHEKNVALFSDSISIPLRKMIGVIGTSPKQGESISCGIPDYHGGNMDCGAIGEGTTLYLPVSVDGALLAMGDLHATMGDGEVSVCGAEIPGAVTVTVTVLKNKKLPTPLLVTDKTVSTIASKKTLDESVVLATEQMVELLGEYMNLPMDEAVSFLSLAGDLKICQVVDPNKTVRMEVPLSYFKQEAKALFLD